MELASLSNSDTGSFIIVAFSMIGSAFNVSWIESSDSESELAKVVAQYMLEQDNNTQQICQFLENLAEFLSADKTKQSEEIRQLLAVFPQLKTIDISRPFPEHSKDLTTNFFSRLCYEISNLLGKNEKHGVVGTPSVLAIDIVRIAATCWLMEHSTISQEEILRVLWCISPISLEKCQQVGSILSHAIWYDPCVGGGVFPLAILLLFAQLNVPIEANLLSRIQGIELDSASVTASLIRFAFAVSTLTGQQYEVARSSVTTNFASGNALEACSEQCSVSLNSLSRLRNPADIVVGNPPYVRANRLDGRTKRYLKSLYPSIGNGSVDLYNYFIAHGILSLKHFGTLCYVSPASFQKSKYGASTREFVYKFASLKWLFDFDELPIFKGASVHASVYTLTKRLQQENYYTYGFTELPKKAPLLLGIQNSVQVSAKNVGINGWTISSLDAENILHLLKANSISLSHHVGRILSGIKTGCKEAFFISPIQAQEFLKDEQSAPFLKPTLRPASIQSWKSQWDGTYLLLIKKGEIVPDESTLMRHLLKYETKLRQRSDVRGHPTWYGLRECGYYSLFEQPKIVFPDIASKCRFSIDQKGYLIPDGAFLLPSSDFCLLGILNSCVGWFYFSNRCNSIGNPHNGGRLRFKKTYVKEFPVPRYTEANRALRQEIEELSRAMPSSYDVSPQLSEKLNYLSLLLYSIPKHYWSLFLES